MHATSTTRAAQPQVYARSKITNARGDGLLPDVDQRSTWARLFRDRVQAMASHCGGADHMSEPQRSLCRRVAALEAESVFLESKFAKLRSEGQSPDAGDVDLYSRISNTQRRLYEAIGIQPTARDVTPSLGEYLQRRASTSEASAA